MRNCGRWLCQLVGAWRQQQCSEPADFSRCAGRVLDIEIPFFRSDPVGFHARRFIILRVNGEPDLFPVGGPVRKPGYKPIFFHIDPRVPAWRAIPSLLMDTWPRLAEMLSRPFVYVKSTPILSA